MCFNSHIADQSLVLQVLFVYIVDVFFYVYVIEWPGQCDESHMLSNLIDKERKEGCHMGMFMNYLSLFLLCIFQRNVEIFCRNLYLWTKYSIFCIHCLQVFFHVYMVFDELS